MATLPRIRIWDGPTRLFHWSIVVLLGFSWWSAETHQMEWHQLSGLTLAGLVMFRLIWGVVGGSTARFAGFVRGPVTVWRYLRGHAPEGIGHNPLGALSVIALLLALMVQIGTGLFAVDIDGIESGPLSYLVDFDQGRLAAEIHDVAFTVLQALAVLHVVAIAWYLAVKRRNLIGPMVLGSRAARDGDSEELVRAPWWRLAVAVVVAVGIAWALAKGFEF